MGRLIVAPTMSNADGHKTNTVFVGEMKVLGKSVYYGPHIYSATPMIRIELDLGLLENWPTNKIPRFKERLLGHLPGLAEHGCSYKETGGLLRRIEEGTWLGHVIEHVAIEFQNLAGFDVSRGKTRSVKGKPGVYNVMFEYELEDIGLAAGRFALELVGGLLPEGLAGVEGADMLLNQKNFKTVPDAITQLKAIAAAKQLGPTTKCIADAAKKAGIPVTSLGNGSLLQLGWGKNQRRIRASMSDATSQIAVDIACNKDLTKQMLDAAGIPVPAGAVVTSLEDAVKEAQAIGYPVVLKPLDGNHGRGITTNIRNAVEMNRAYALAVQHGKKVIVERFYLGKDYRVLVIDGKVVAVSERVPAHVIGNAKNTVAELIEILNKDPRRGDGHEAALSRVIINTPLQDCLAKAGLSLGSVPAAGVKVFLCDTANLSTGGTAIDRTDEIHPDNIATFERAARVIGLDIAGIDVISKDIARPLAETGGGIVEINAAPGFRMHAHPSEGRARPVGEAVISMLFPESKPSRIPVVSITGTNGKSTTTRMVAHILRQQGANVGYTSTLGVYVNEALVWKGDASGPASAGIILRDPTVDYAVLETARGGILRRGLGFDVCDVGSVLNISADHLGIGGIDTLQDLADVKSVVVESVSRTGMSILNADDPLTYAMAEYAGGRVCFFSMKGGAAMTPQLRAHIDSGGIAFVCEKSKDKTELVIYEEGRRLVLVDAEKIPATFGGLALFNIENALAAAAITYGLKMNIHSIRTGLMSFHSSFEQNPGRLNVHDANGFRTIVDYAHNPAGLSGLAHLVNRMRDKYGHVIGTVSTPGDRRDEDIIAMGRIAAEALDIIVLREGDDQRGRPPGEVNALMKKGALQVGFPSENIICVLPEESAIELCLRKAKPGDLVVLTPSDVDACWKAVNDFQPVSADFTIAETKGIVAVQAY